MDYISHFKRFGLAEWIKIQLSMICCLQETLYYYWKSMNEKKKFYMEGNKNWAGVYIGNKVDFK